MAAVRKVYQSLQSTAGTQGLVRLVSDWLDCGQTGVRMVRLVSRLVSDWLDSGHSGVRLVCQTG